MSEYMVRLIALLTVLSWEMTRTLVPTPYTNKSSNPLYYTAQCGFLSPGKTPHRRLLILVTNTVHLRHAQQLTVVLFIQQPLRGRVARSTNVNAKMGVHATPSHIANGPWETSGMSVLSFGH